jgi:plasmid stabilization system protein ParE
MSIVILPDARDDLLSLQGYMLERWNKTLWLKAEDEIFQKLAELDSGFLSGTVVQAFAEVGIFDYKTSITSHHRILHRKIDDTLYVYAIAGHQQDFQTLLMRRMFNG